MGRLVGTKLWIPLAAGSNIATSSSRRDGLDTLGDRVEEVLSSAFYQIV